MRLDLLPGQLGVQTRLGWEYFLAVMMLREFQAGDLPEQTLILVSLHLY